MWVPTVLKNNSGLSSSWVGRPAGRAHSGAFLAADSSVAQGSWLQRHWCSSRVARSAAACRRGLSHDRPLHAEHLVSVTWCQSPGEHVSDETAHAPSLSQRDPAVLQHCVRRFAVASNAEHGSVERSAPFLEPGLVTTGVTVGPCCTFRNDT